MGRNKIFRVGAICIGVVIVVVLVFFARIREKEPIVIGAILSISGPTGPTIEGEGVRDGMLLAVEEINTFGGINGSKIELVIEDAKINAEIGKEIFQNMEAGRKPLLYVSTHSSVSSALAPLVEENNVVLFVALATDPGVTKEKEWVFRYWPTAEVEMPALMTLLKATGVRNLGVIYLDDEFGRSISSGLAREVGKIGGTVRGEPFSIRETDFKDEIAELSSYEGILGVGFPQHVKAIFKQLRDEDYKGNVFSTIAAADVSFHTLPEANGVYITAPIIYNPTFLFAQGLKEKYEARFDKPLTYFAANGYDLIKMLAALLEDEEFSRENVKKLLEAGFTHPGVLGTVDVGEGEHDMAFPIHPAQIIDGTVRYQY
ncbi:MAG: ABC transporter substrate-binding protein [Candidatus Spechtbacterales bacterium]